MCGIACIISNNSDHHSLINEFTDVVKHRGPDARGIFHDRDVSLGHRRLKIIDLSDNANQPIEYNGIYIVFNGEIYNHKTLRRDLESHCHVFKTNSDTEVILHEYAEHPDTFLNYLEGMFSFVIYDSNKNIIIAARDRFGIKPLYCTRLDDGYAFASEIKQFKVLKKLSINEEASIRFLQSGLIDTDKFTLVNGVYNILPGHFIRGSTLFPYAFEEGIWYDVREAYQTRPNCSTFLTIQNLLRESIKDHMVADVPIGSCLSGGIDSSGIVCMVNRIGHKKQHVFTARSENKEIDEGKWVDLVDKYCGTLERHDIYPNVDTLFKDLPSIIYHQDSPFPTTSMYAQWCIFKEASKYVKCVLDGQAADEAFGGYHMYHGVAIGSLIKSLAIAPTIAYSVKLIQDRHVDKIFVAKCLLANLMGGPNLTGYSLNQITSTSLPALLHWEDRNSMAFSVEARVPYCDHTLIEYALALPDKYKLRRGTTKFILREALHNIIPEEIVQRRDKIGFFTSEKEWFYNRKTHFVERYNESRHLIPKCIEDECNKIIMDIKPYNTVLWRVITYGEFVNCVSSFS